MSGDAVTVRVSRSLVPFDAGNEARAVSQIAAWAEPMRRDFDQAFSREWIEETLRDALRRGLVDIIGVIEAAEKNDDELADNALRAVAGELMERREGRPGEGQILAYLQRHASSPPLRRKRGRAWPSNWRRDFLICAMIEIAKPGAWLDADPQPREPTQRPLSVGLQPGRQGVGEQGDIPRREARSRKHLGRPRRPPDPSRLRPRVAYASFHARGPVIRPNQIRRIKMYERAEAHA